MVNRSYCSLIRFFRIRSTPKGTTEIHLTLYVESFSLNARNGRYLNDIVLPRAQIHQSQLQQLHLILEMLSLLTPKVNYYY